MKTLKVLSALLTYPTPELIGAGDEMKAVLVREKVLARPHISAVVDLIDDLMHRDIFDAQERYVLLFDRTRSLSLHLFEHVHGESRDRGQAMVDLIKLYEDGGFSPTEAELPDFLPLFLEYASTRAPGDAIELIAQPAHVMAALRERIAKRKTPYEAVFAALVTLSKATLNEAQLAALCAEPDPEPDDLEALDAAWEDEEVRFGPSSAADCGRDGLAAKLRHANRPAPGMTPQQPARTAPAVTYSRSNRA